MYMYIFIYSSSSVYAQVYIYIYIYTITNADLLIYSQNTHDVGCADKSDNVRSYMGTEKTYNLV